MVSIIIDKNITSQVLNNPNKVMHKLDSYMQALIEDPVISEYVDELPKDRGDLALGIKARKRGFMDYIAESTTKGERNFDYGLSLYTGTLSYRGQRDAGYESGKIRETNNYGFGVSTQGRENAAGFFGMLMKKGKIKGIKPNKAADRAKDTAEPIVIDKIEKFINTRL